MIKGDEFQYMNIEKIYEFLEENACKTKQDIIKKLMKKFSLDSKIADEIYKDWKKEYIKFKG